MSSVVPFKNEIPYRLRIDIEGVASDVKVEITWPEDLWLTSYLIRKFVEDLTESLKDELYEVNDEIMDRNGW